MMARLLYGTAFVVGVPLLLAVWAWRLDVLIRMPVVRSPWLGGALVGVGLALMGWATQALRVHGGGLPMNAFPPPRPVRVGPYRWVGHPIYLGFVAVCFGVSLLVGSAAGLWIVSPLAAAGCVALVWGYEAHDLARRFGTARPAPALGLPPRTAERPRLEHVLSAGLLVYVPWLLLYELVGHVPAPDAVSGYFPFERSWPVIQWTEVIYGSAYAVALAAIPLAPTQADLRRFMVVGWVGTALGMLTFLVAPVKASPRPLGEPFAPTSVWGHLLELERSLDVGATNAFPAFHVFWALLLAWLLARRGGWWPAVAWTWATAVAVSCITTGMHALVDLPAGLLLFALAFRADRLWAAAVRGGERIANSWREWRLGPVRVINHGFYAALAAAVGTLLAGRLVGPDGLVGLGLLAGVSLVGGGICGQIVVGSRTLLRPFGYFGSVVGLTLAFCVAIPAGADLWTEFAALAVAGPWVQAIGRCRCLVQGCCHGAPVQGDHAHTIGIRYRHPRSRVCKLADLTDVPVHPTPLYSMLGNAVTGLLLLRLWLAGASASLIVGGYFLLAGLARFVEESYRGEPQTPILAGLRLYQWLAIGLVLVGVAITSMPPPDAPAPALRFHWSILFAAAAIGLAHLFAMGVDFPDSNRRFSRLI